MKLRRSYKFAVLFCGVMSSVFAFYKIYVISGVIGGVMFGLLLALPDVKAGGEDGE